MICYDTLLGSALDNDANGGILLIENRTSVVDNSGRLNYRCVVSTSKIKIESLVCNNYENILIKTFSSCNLYSILFELSLFKNLLNSLNLSGMCVEFNGEL